MENEDATIEDSVLLEIVHEQAPISTGEVADAVGCSRRAAEYRLRALHADGELVSEAVGRELLWRPAPR